MYNTKYCRDCKYCLNCKTLKNLYAECTKFKPGMIITENAEKPDDCNYYEVRQE